MNLQESIQAWRSHSALHAQKGVVLPGVQAYLPAEFKYNFALAMDAQPALSTEANSAIPAFLTMYIDPAIFAIVFAANMAAEIFGEVKKGDWLTDTAAFPTVEHTGEVSSYGDYNNNGSAGANANWPQRQSYLFQTIKEYGEREIERAGLGRLSWVSEIDGAAATVLNKFSNLSYFFGISGLQNYGLLNDPDLSAALTPAPKAYGGSKWINNGVIVATANEIYLDIESMYIQLVAQSNGLIDQKTKMTLALGTNVAPALTATNSFNVNVSDLVKKNFPSLEVKTAVQYNQTSSSNPQGVTAGNEVQLLADAVEGQDVGYCAFSEKMRAHTIVKELSAFKQKLTGGTWGAIIRMPLGIASMVGV